MSRVKATVVLPTTENRGALLPYSVGSIQNQTVQDLEIFIIGDGVTDETKEIIQKLMDEDTRIQFFDHPKHERRGEPYRHKALQGADSEIVCYLCDRDLMLPNHLEMMLGLLQDYNFASTTFIDVKKDQSLNVHQYLSYYGAASENDPELVKPGKISLSNVGHTLSLYRKLPFGWRTTPGGEFTDRYMWQQLLAHTDCSAYSHYEPTTLYFGRGHYPGLPVPEREKELAIWFPKIKEKKTVERIRDEAFRGIFTQRIQLLSFKKKFKSTLLIKGYKINELPSRIFQKVSRRLKRL